MGISEFFISTNDTSALKSMPTKTNAPYSEEELDHFQNQIKDYQEMIYASKSHGLLIVFQGLDTSGKDGAIRKVFRSVQPLGLRAINFSYPSKTESRHNFLWRIHQKLPSRGEMAIFNRSHYEDLVTAFVRGTIDKVTLDKRIQHVIDFEKMLFEENILTFKFFLNISKEEQRQRLIKRLQNPNKHWKFDPNDLKDRENWQQFIDQYSYVIGRTSSSECPWFSIPSDDKSLRNLITSSIVAERLAGLNLRYPKAKEEIKNININEIN